MAIETTNRKVTFDGDGSTTEFSIPFRYLDDAHVFVVLYDPITEEETTQTITTDYTMSGDGFYGRGTVTMGTAPASGKRLIIYRDTEILQTYELFDNEAQTATDIELALDKLTMIAQELEEGLSRTVTRNIITEAAPLPDSNVSVTDVFLGRVTGAPTEDDHPFEESEPVASSSTNQALTGGRTGTFKYADLCENDKTNDYVFIIQMLDTAGNTVYRSWQQAVS